MITKEKLPENLKSKAINLSNAVTDSKVYNKACSIAYKAARFELKQRRERKGGEKLWHAQFAKVKRSLSVRIVMEKVKKMGVLGWAGIHVNIAKGQVRLNVAAHKYFRIINLKNHQ